MAYSYKPSMKMSTLTSTADMASWYCALVLLALVLLASISHTYDHDGNNNNSMNRIFNRPCDEVYVVQEGETLHSISEKCGDPFIVEQNPHIHDPDDVFPGLVIKITPPPKKLE